MPSARSTSTGPSAPGGTDRRLALHSAYASSRTRSTESMHTATSAPAPARARWAPWRAPAHAPGPSAWHGLSPPPSSCIPCSRLGHTVPNPTQGGPHPAVTREGRGIRRPAESACSWSGCSREFECQQRFRSQPLQEAVPTGAQRRSVSPSPTTGSLSSAALRDVCHPAAGPVHVPPGDGHAHALLHLPISGGGAVRSCRAEVSELQALGDASGTVSPPVTQVECREGRHKWPSDLGQPCTTKVGPGGARCTPSLLRAHPQPPSKRGVYLLSEAVLF